MLSGRDHRIFGRIPPFPALYIAEDYPTAFREHFGSDADVKSHGLTGAELALRAPASFTHIALRGQLELVMDLSELRSLQPFAAVLRKFSLPDNIRRLSRQLGMRSPPFLVRSAAALQRQLLLSDWRVLPAQLLVTDAYTRRCAITGEKTRASSVMRRERLLQWRTVVRIWGES